MYFFDIVPSSPIDIRQKRRARRRTLSSSASTKSTFSSQYEINGPVLGEGAYGSVYKCNHIKTDIEYAVKIISKQGQVAKKVNFEKKKNGKKNASEIMGKIDFGIIYILII